MRNCKYTGGVTTFFIWHNGNLVYEYNDYETGGTAYTYGLSLISSDDYKYVLDGHGSVMAVFDNETNFFVRWYDYDAFGNTNNDPTDTNPFRYCAEYFDTETQSYYLRARNYNPSNGRFTQVDPIKDGLNWYVYCNNNPLKYVDPSGLTYVIAWSYGKADLKPYTDAQGNVNWTKFTAENSFARAAATRKQELIDMGVPASEIDIQRIDNEADMKSTWEMWAGYDIIEGMNIYSHGYSDGISVAGGGGEFLSDTTKLKWGSMLRSLKVDGKTVGVVTSPYAVFHGCNTANGDFAQNFANTQGVTTYAQTGYASFSRNPTWHVPINDGVTGGSVYLYHFNWNNIENTDGLGKVFYAQ